MAKVLSFEDDSDMRSLVRHVIKSSGHELIAEADNPFSAVDVIARFAAQAGIAIVDGNLGFGKDDGSLVIQDLKAANSKIITVGNSLDRDVFGADRQAQKNFNLLKTILQGIR